jgi:hypothetical protein
VVADAVAPGNIELVGDSLDQRALDSLAVQSNELQREILQESGQLNSTA